MSDGHEHHGEHHTDPTFYRSPRDAAAAPAEKLAYVAAFARPADKPDAIAVVDVDPDSASYSSVVGFTELPNIGDELHHFGWNACSSACHSQLARDTLVVPGFRSSRIHLLDVTDPRAPRVRDVIEPQEIFENATTT
jgi:selenium-binding protein 1